MGDVALYAGPAVSHPKGWQDSRFAADSKEAEKVGFAETPGRRKIPRLQILTFKELLDERKQFIIPEGYRLPKYTGVGKAAVRQAAIEFDEDASVLDEEEV
jgi:hypothetical protein